MSIRTIEVKAFEIAASPGVDPIRLIVQDIGPGQGRVTIECFGKAWAYYWGAMGERDVLSFLRMADADYIAGAMSMSMGRRSTKAEDAYLLRIVKAVKAAIETLPHQTK